jgi:hypothetical protein
MSCSTNPTLVRDHFVSQIDAAPSLITTREGAVHLLTPPPGAAAVDCHDALQHLVERQLISSYAAIPPGHASRDSAFLALRGEHFDRPAECHLQG